MNRAVALALLLVVSSSASQKAAKLAHRSIIEYNAGDFAKALEDAKSAYELDPRPALLFNLGQCHRAMGNIPQALFSYRGYLREAPDAPNRAVVLGLIADLEAAAKAQAAPPTPPPLVVEAPGPPTRTPAAAPESVPAAAVTQERPGSGLPASVWWVGGSAVAAGVAGTILGVLAASAGDAKSSDGPYTIHSISPGAYQTAQNEGLSADILWGVGGALLVTAVVVALVR